MNFLKWNDITCASHETVLSLSHRSITKILTIMSSYLIVYREEYEKYEQLRSRITIGI